MNDSVTEQLVNGRRDGTCAFLNASPPFPLTISWRQNNFLRARASGKPSPYSTDDCEDTTHAQRTIARTSSIFARFGRRDASAQRHFANCVASRDLFFRLGEKLISPPGQGIYLFICLMQCIMHPTRGKIMQPWKKVGSKCSVRRIV